MGKGLGGKDGCSAAGSLTPYLKVSEGEKSVGRDTDL